MEVRVYGNKGGDGVLGLFCGAEPGLHEPFVEGVGGVRGGDGGGGA